MMSPGKFNLAQSQITGSETLIASGYVSSMMILQNQLVDDPVLILVVVRHPLSSVFPILNDVPWEIQPSSISNHSWGGKTLNASGYISYLIIMAL